MAIDPTLRDALSAVTVASLARVLARRGVPACSLHGITGTGAAVGPAATLRMIPARGDVAGSLAEAIEAVPDGAVVVIDTGRSGLDLPFAAILAARLAQRGVAGLVTDGTLTAEAGLPAWSAAMTPGSGSLSLAGSGEAIACAGAAVHPGDIVVGGPDGVIVIPRDIAEAVALEAVEQQRLDLWLAREAETGASLRTLLPPDAATLARFEAETGA
ncbi:dimethylmenaquinone methyltransferase [uncultured Methylobacterium sp.]|uniref:RraA family protein n=1 Tax=uncultured Methylobacterium sp. TaxID=157278 RepID=UPI0035CC3DFB